MKTSRRLLLVLGLTTFVIYLVWFFRPSEHSLLDKSVPVSGVHVGYNKDQYYWISDHELLLFHWVHDFHWEVIRRDVKNQTETPLLVLDHLFQQTGGQPESVKVSPDHTRLIWAGIGKLIYGATTEGQQFQQWPYGKKEFGISYWLNDGSHFLRYLNFNASPTSAILRSVNHPHTVTPLLLSCQSASPKWRMTRPSSPVETIFVEEGLGEEAEASVTISRFTMTKIQRTVRDVPLPPEDEYFPRSEPRFLSQEDSLIWTISQSPPPKTPALLREFLARLGWRPKPLQTLGAYVSRADGTQWRFVGDWEEPKQIFYVDIEKYPLNFRWLPGGKRISFERQGALYTVSAD